MRLFAEPPAELDAASRRAIVEVNCELFIAFGDVPLPLMNRRFG
jgi:hypothetical protein